MRWQTLVLMTVGTTLIVILTACGGGTATSSGGGTTTSTDKTYDLEASMASLQQAGWQPSQQTEDLPEPYTGVRLVGDLEATAPDGEPVELEFYESPQAAQGELEETKKQEPPFEGAAVGNVMTFDPEADTAALSQENLNSVQDLLR